MFNWLFPQKNKEKSENNGFIPHKYVVKKHTKNNGEVYYVVVSKWGDVAYHPNKSDYKHGTPEEVKETVDYLNELDKKSWLEQTGKTEDISDEFYL